MSDRVTNVATVGVVLLTMAVLARPGGAAHAKYSEWQEARRSKAAYAAHVPALRETGQWLGRQDTSRFVVEFSDYECPYCRMADPVVSAARDREGGVAVLYVHLPLPSHPLARPAAAAALCGDAAGKGFETHRVLMSTTDWQQSKDWAGIARQAGVGDIPAFERCLVSAEVQARIERGIASADSMNVRATPTFIGPSGRHLGVPTGNVLDLIANRGE